MTELNMRRERLEQLIREVGSTQRLSHLTGVPQASIVAYRRGTHFMGDKTARQLEAAMGLPVGWLDGVEQEPILESVKQLIWRIFNGDPS